MSKLGDAASRVADLVGPEPILLSCLRAQMENHRSNILTAVETKERLTVQLPADGEATSPREPVTIQEEKTTLTIVEETPADSKVNEKDQFRPCPTSSDSEIPLDPSSLNLNPVSQESSDSPEATVKMTFTVPNSPTAPASTYSDSTQFLASPSPVYA